MAAQEVMRWQLDVPLARARELDAFADTYGFATRKDLINTALSLLQWSINEVKGGRIIAAVDERNMRYKQIDLPAFKMAADQAPSSEGVAKAAELLAEVDRLAQAEGSSALQQKVKAAQAVLDEIAAA